MIADEFTKLVLACGATNAAVLPVNQIALSAEFREICKGNACGNYGKCYMCPPDVGEIDNLMQEIRTFDTSVMYQSVYALEDSFDFEGMQAAGTSFSGASGLIHEKAKEIMKQPWLHLGAGGCHVCDSCAKRDDLPCREPEQALTSLEAYGVDVYQTALKAGLSYINGQNTVTYFGMLLF